MARKKAKATRRILGLDLGTTTGVAVMSFPDDEPMLFDYETHRFTKKKGEGPGARFLKFEHSLVLLLCDAEYSAVAYEEIAKHGPSGMQAAHVYGGLLAILQKECERRDIPCIGYSVATLKKAATGYGGSRIHPVGKADVMEAVRRRFDLEETPEENAADGIAAALALGIEQGWCEPDVSYAVEKGWIDG